jgi:hypothetical protein
MKTLGDVLPSPSAVELMPPLKGLQWPPLRKWQAFVAITLVGPHVLADLDEISLADCVQMTVTMLREKPCDAAAKRALGFVIPLLTGGPTCHGQICSGPSLMQEGPHATARSGLDLH